MTLAWLSNPMLVLVNLLAAFRLTRLLVDDSLPPIALWRMQVSRWADERWAPSRRIYNPEADDAEPTGADADKLLAYGRSPLANLLACYWCAGFWMSAAVTLLASTGTWWLWAAAPLALSAAVGLLARLAD